MALIRLRRRRRHVLGTVRLDRAYCAFVAGWTETPVEQVRGYLVTAIKLDGSIEVAHNYCCLAHVLNLVNMAAVCRSDLMSTVYAPDPASTR